jgi:hypothetical protein
MICAECGCKEEVHSEDWAALQPCVGCFDCHGYEPKQETLPKPKSEKGVRVRAHCTFCDWDGYTNNLDDACYDCGQYESLKEIEPDVHADVNHAEFC